MQRLTLLVLALSALGATPVAAADALPPAIHVRGDAELSTAPDHAELSVHVLSRGATATDAAADNATRSAAVTKALRGALGDAGTIRTESYTVTPQYRYKDGDRTLIGYLAQNSIGVEITDLARLGGVAAAALDAGADSIANLRVDLRDDTALRAEALALAAGRARAKANAIANALGLKVVRVLAVSEDGAMPEPRPMLRQSLAMEAARAGTPEIEPGPIRIVVSVELTLEVAD